MPEINRADVQAAWQTMSRSYGWSLARDEAALIERALSECEQLGSTGRGVARLGIWRVYGALMYEQLRAGNEQAAAELWRMFAHTAMKRGKRQDIAEDLAQETVLRVLIKLPALKSPTSFLTWALRIFGTVRRESEADEASEAKTDSADEYEQTDEHDFTQAIERRLELAEIAAQLRVRLNNDLERAVIIRAIIDGDNPRDIAADLRIPVTRVRVAKSRALRQLRDDPTFQAWLREQSGDSSRALGDTGASDNDE